MSDEWLLLGSTDEHYYIFNKGPQLSLYGVAGAKNGVGLLDSTCEYLYTSNKYPGCIVRNLKTFDLRRRREPPKQLVGQQPENFYVKGNGYPRRVVRRTTRRNGY